MIGSSKLKLVNSLVENMFRKYSLTIYYVYNFFNIFIIFNNTELFKWENNVYRVLKNDFYLIL